MPMLPMNYMQYQKFASKFLSLNQKNFLFLTFFLKTFLNILIIIKISIYSTFFATKALIIFSIILSILFVCSLILTIKKPSYIENLSLIHNIAIVIFIIEFDSTLCVNINELNRAEVLNYVKEAALLIVLVLNENYRCFWKKSLHLFLFLCYVQIKFFIYSEHDLKYICLILLAFFILLYHSYFLNRLITEEKKIMIENNEYLLLFDTLSKYFPSNLFSFQLQEIKLNNNIQKFFHLNSANESARKLFNLTDNVSLENLLERIYLNSNDVLDTNTAPAYSPTLTHNNLMKYLLQTIEDEKIFSQIKNTYEKIPLVMKFMTTYSDDINISQKKISKKYRVFIIKFFHNNNMTFIINMEDMHLEEEIIHLKEMDKLKDEMLASITHDLRSPLSSVLKWIEFAKNSKDLDENHKNLDLAENNGNLLMNLINDILDYSSMKNGKFKLNYIKFKLSDLIGDILSMMRIQAIIKDIDIQVENHCSENMIIYSDIVRIKQVIYNLIGNSLKFTSKNGTIIFRIKPVSRHNIIKFSIIDNGAGIKQEILPKLCKPFHSYDYNGVYNKQGIGLGLHICTMIVSQLGPFDHLKIQSKFGEGSKFSFYLFAVIDLKKNKLKTADNIKEIESNHLNYAIQKQSEDFLLELSNFHSKEFFSSPSDNNVNNDLIEIEDFNKKKVPFSQFHKKIIRKTSIENCDIENKTSTTPEHKKSCFINQGHDTTITEYNNNNANNKNYNRSEEDQNIMLKGDIQIKALLVDDDGFSLMILQKFLNEFMKKFTNIKIVSENAYNGVEALELFKKHNHPESSEPFNVIFMDGLMPIQNGFDTAEDIQRSIKKLNYKKCTIIGCTALDDLQKCLKSGMDRVLMKPIQKDGLFEELKMIYEEKQKII